MRSLTVLRNIQVIKSTLPTQFGPISPYLGNTASPMHALRELLCALETSTFNSIFRQDRTREKYSNWPRASSADVLRTL